LYYVELVGVSEPRRKIYNFSYYLSRVKQRISAVIFSKIFTTTKECMYIYKQSINSVCWLFLQVMLIRSTRYYFPKRNSIIQNNKMHLNYTNILIFMFLYVSKSRVHLQENGCTYSYGVICISCTSSFVGGILPTKLLLSLACKQIVPHLYVQTSSWRWTLGFETCRRHRKN
jgi:hypothetical protein